MNQLFMPCFRVVILGAVVACNGAPAAKCPLGDPISSPKPDGYGFVSEHGWTCAEPPSPISEIFVSAATFISTFGAPSTQYQGFDTDIMVASDQLIVDVMSPAVAAWYTSGADFTIPYSIDLGPALYMSRNGQSVIVAQPGAYSGPTIELVGAGALTEVFPSLYDPTVTEECDTVIFEDWFDAKTSTTHHEYYQREDLGYGSLYSWIVAHEIGHCLNLLDQKDEWHSAPSNIKSSIMWYQAADDQEPALTNEDIDAVRYVFGP